MYLSVRPRGHLRNHTGDLYLIFGARCLRSWLDLRRAKWAKSDIYDCIVRFVVNSLDSLSYSKFTTNRTSWVSHLYCTQWMSSFMATNIQLQSRFSSVTSRRILQLLRAGRFIRTALAGVSHRSPKSLCQFVTRHWIICRLSLIERRRSASRRTCYAMISRLRVYRTRSNPCQTCPVYDAYSASALARRPLFTRES